MPSVGVLVVLAVKGCEDPLRGGPISSGDGPRDAQRRDSCPVFLRKAQVRRMTVQRCSAHPPPPEGGQGKSNDMQGSKLGTQDHTGCVEAETLNHEVIDGS